MPIGPPREGASRREMAEHVAKLVYQEIMGCRHCKVDWRTRDGVTNNANPMVIQPFSATPKTIVIEIDGGCGQPVWNGGEVVTS